MSGQDYVVPPWSWAGIGKLADNVRVQFSLSTKPAFPVIDFLERVLDQKLAAVRLEIVSEAEMGAYEGLTDPRGEFIRLRQDVYEKACQEDGRARFTVAHELGHLFLHSNVPMARISPERSLPGFRRCEPQANQFAAELLMPRSFMRTDDTVTTVVQRHTVSQEAARLRIDYMRKNLWRT